MNTSASSLDFDIIIAGGGMIGMSMALAIAPLNLRIAVVEKVHRDQVQQPSFDDRSTALSRSSQSMYQALGLWDEILSASTPIKSIHVSDRGKFGFSHINAEEQKVEALEAALEKRQFEQAERLKAFAAKIAPVAETAESDVTSETGSDTASSAPLDEHAVPAESKTTRSETIKHVP